ncbi:MAG: hypothetical protein IJY89_00615 [Clostridia bacterium]|nr:hypothetical protein [Clostridia bacterium]
MLIEMVIACFLALSFFFIFKGTVLSWLGEYIRFEEAEAKKEDENEKKGEGR